MAGHLRRDPELVDLLRSTMDALFGLAYQQGVHAILDRWRDYEDGDIGAVSLLCHIR